MNARPKRAVVVVCLALLALALVTVAAQDAAPLLTLTSPDSEHPAQFQLLAPGDAPRRGGFTSSLEIPGPVVDPDLSRVYVALENTGWSAGVVGLFSDALDPAGQYVALEVDADGVPVEGGLVFDLVYDEKLGREGGFRLAVLIAGPVRFALFPAGIEDGQPFPAVTNARAADGTVSPIAVGLSLEAEPVAICAPLVLECHIIAHFEATPTPAPALVAPVSSEGWGACGSCAACGHPGECVLSPDGQCFWNPGGCGAAEATGGDPAPVATVPAGPPSLPTPTQTPMTPTATRAP